ncbi:MAG: defect-in-organelle-trafficking protein DotC [Oleiphilaceae bacterium]|jgi:defect-in-organelle-trafficking protein DotC
MNFPKIIFSGAIIISLAGCASTSDKQVEDIDTSNPLYYKEINDLAGQSIKSLSEAIKGIVGDGSRLHVIREGGFKAGRSAAIKARNKTFNEYIGRYNIYLSSVFNFEQLLIGGSYLPPRIDIIRGQVTKGEDGSLNKVRLGYRIATEPTLVTQKPTHLNYLYRLPQVEATVSDISLPIKGNRVEVETWTNGVKDGWVHGMRQAEIAFVEDINLLHRDFTGLLRYIELANKGIVAMPDISTIERGIVMSKDGRMLNVGDEIVSIDSDPLFKSYQLWTPRIQSFVSEETVK